AQRAASHRAQAEAFSSVTRLAVEPHALAFVGNTTPLTARCSRCAERGQLHHGRDVVTDGALATATAEVTRAAHAVRVGCPDGVLLVRLQLLLVVARRRPRSPSRPRSVAAVDLVALHRGV